MNARRWLALVWWKALAELKAEAARAYIGILWWVVEPALYMAAFYLAFGAGIRAGGVHAVPFLLTGLVAWKWFASSVQGGSGAIQANSGLIQQVYVPKAILPFIVMVTNGIKFLVVLVLLLLVLTAMGYPPDITWVALPAVIVVEFLLIVALGSLAASLLPLLPDLKLIVDNGLIVMMFLSGIFYDVDKLPPGPAAIMRFNPMIWVIESFRHILMRHSWPQWDSLLVVALASLAVYALALVVLRAYDRHYTKLMVG
jgi:lipopolysaccharide transport system permease protein